MRRTLLIAAREHKGYSQADMAKALKTALRTYVRWEHGEVTPQPHHRAALRDQIGVDDAELTRILAHIEDEEGLVDRRELLGAGFRIGVGAAMFATAPRRVGRSEIARVTDTAALITRWSREYGGGGMPPEIMDAHVRWAAGLLHTSVPTPLRGPLFSAVGYLCAFAGFSRFDAYDHRQARQLFAIAQQCAEEVGDWSLRARAHGMAARQAIWIGDPDTGLTHVELGLVRSDRITPTEVAALHTLRARALARLRRVEDAREATGAADTAFARRSPGDASPMAYYDEAQHRGDTGHALADLSRIGAPTDAAERLAYSVRHHPAGTERARVMSQVELADLRLSTGEPEAAVEAIEIALPGAAELRSARTRDLLQRVQRRAIAAPDGRAVTALRERLAAHFEAAA
ncbi:hypothetical protein Afil01_31520 [Actinorhabdospora filicis]|uniref:HTH cro/C1-type domain-containing protein n=1 Tax=Actinorhabdospora filicis TaxID=1785913 RepID=A0A9W6SLZ2_9ACTN|nr:helix-turn-helix transcriptional regulator [Actinorhabdospora filicis]GLZ78345.1 hypothetical protein Afil01_31520 [Actinorhabdospora filicis]